MSAFSTITRSAAFALAVASTAGLPPAQAQETGKTLADKMTECVTVEDDASRLACFDRVAEPLAQPEKPAIETFAGEGDWTSDTLTVREGWRVAWQSTGEMLTVELRDADNYFTGIAGSQVGPGEGESDPIEPGTYHLNVRASGGGWTIRVTPADSPQTD